MAYEDLRKRLNAETIGLRAEMHRMKPEQAIASYEDVVALADSLVDHDVFREIYALPTDALGTDHGKALSAIANHNAVTLFSGMRFEGPLIGVALQAAGNFLLGRIEAVDCAVVRELYANAMKRIEGE